VEDVIQAKVINVSRAEKKIGLSVKRLDESEEREIYKSYAESRDGATSNLGEILKKEMQGLESQGSTGDKKQKESAGIMKAEQPEQNEDQSNWKDH
jgi:predicted RNA-binding protein with RPS1 domain